MKLIYIVILSMFFITSCTGLSSKRCLENSNESVNQCHNNLIKKKLNNNYSVYWSFYEKNIIDNDIV